MTSITVNFHLRTRLSRWLELHTLYSSAIIIHRPLHSSALGTSSWWDVLTSQDTTSFHAIYLSPAYRVVLLPGVSLGIFCCARVTSFSLYSELYATVVYNEGNMRFRFFKQGRLTYLLTLTLPPKPTENLSKLVFPTELSIVLRTCCCC